jgi:AraC-like DNA-binding protein
MKTTDQTWEGLAGKVQYKPALLARECGVSLRTLQRHFRKTYQTTASDWLRKMRMREAYARLQEGFRVKEVAIDLGYKQMSHFSRDFKAAFGITPSELSNRRPAWSDSLPDAAHFTDKQLAGAL